MKTKKSDILICALFLGFIFAMLVCYLVLPSQNFSEKEKRYLSEKPALTWETLLSGQYGQDVETYLADHIPGRDLFVGLASYYDLFSGRQVTKDIYLAEGDRLVEKPVVLDPAVVEKNMSKINQFAEKIGRPVDLMLIPSAGFILEDTISGLTADYTDDDIISAIYAMAGESVVCRDAITVLKNSLEPQSLYYRTDHHWTSYGAYTVYRAYMQLLGREYVNQEDFTVERYGGFYGTTYSRSGLWLTKGDDVELWKTDTNFQVTNGETKEVHDGLFYPERLEELDKYTVYLDGNHSMVRIENPEAAGKGKILVIRDSYANCLGTFLANSYETVVMIDLRYYRQAVSQLLETEEFTDVLVCYSIGNFTTDTYLSILR